MTAPDAPPLVLDLSLAGLDVQVTMHPNEAANAARRFGPFAASAPGPHPVRLVVRHAPETPLPQPAEVPYPGVAVSRNGDVVVFSRRRERLRYDLASRTGELVVDRPPPSPVPGTDPPLVEAALRIVLSVELARAGGLLLHASGFGDEEGAVVFAAASGGGKTTTAAKLPHDNVLSDDQVAVRLWADGWRAYALPFVGLYGRTPRPREAPLQAVALLEKAPSASLTRLRPAGAAARLLGCTVSFLPGEAAERAVDLVERLVLDTPVYALALPRKEPIGPWVAAMRTRRLPPGR